MIVYKTRKAAILAAVRDNIATMEILSQVRGPYSDIRSRKTYLWDYLNRCHSTIYSREVCVKQAGQRVIRYGISLGA